MNINKTPGNNKNKERLSLMRFFKQNPHSFLLGMLCLALLMGLQACQQQSIGTIQGVAKLQDRVAQEGIQILIPGTQFRAITDVTGQFTIQGIPRGTYTVLYKQEGFNPQRQEFKITSSKTVALDTVTLTKKQEPAGRMAGVVKLEGETQHNNILVSLLGTPHNTKTDPQGFYKFSEITPGEYQLLALKDGWLPATRDSLRVQDGEQTDVEPIELASIAKIQSATQAAKMEGEAILRGVAFLEGETDHDGIQVTLENYPDITAETNANGIFKLTGLDTNPHTLIFSYPGYLEERIPNAMPVDASSTATVGYITLQKDVEKQKGFGILQGHVYLEGQESHENTIVRLLGISQSVVTDADGRYMFIGIPSGTYVLTAE
ncbi:hypothetical protein GF373_14185, partial [bacterium]|nr:hypothetical protein [bacterium]